MEKNMIEIIEHTIKSKTGDLAFCEDGLFISNDFVAVIDGATSKGQILWHNKSSGVYAKDIVVDALFRINANSTAQDAVSFINNSLSTAYGNRIQTIIEHPYEQLRASFIIFSELRKEIWSFGDCACLINGIEHVDKKKIDSILAEKRSLFLQEEIKSGKTIQDLIQNDTGRTHILPLLKRQMEYANTNSEYGYPVANGLSINLCDIKVYPVKEGDEIVLASDGYPYLKTSLEHSEEALKHLLVEDTLCYKIFKSTKGITGNNISFDDRTYIRFVFQ